MVEEIERGFGAAPSPELFPGMAGVVETLSAAHPVVVITSSRTGDVERTLRRRGVRGVADVIGGDVEPSKTRKIHAVRRRFGESREAWYVCDTVGDVLEARAAGVGTVGVAWGWHGEERLLGAGPDRIVRRPSDLLESLLTAMPREAGNDPRPPSAQRVSSEIVDSTGTPSRSVLRITQ